MKQIIQDLKTGKTILENIEIVVVTTIWEVLEHALFYEKGKKKIKFNDFKENC